MKKKDTAERILGNLAQAVNNLQGCREFSLLMPEVRVNLVYALPGAVKRQASCRRLTAG